MPTHAQLQSGTSARSTWDHHELEEAQNTHFLIVSAGNDDSPRTKVLLFEWTLSRWTSVPVSWVPVGRGRGVDQAAY